jgi:hypothetical protein
MGVFRIATASLLLGGITGSKNTSRYPGEMGRRAARRADDKDSAGEGRATDTDLDSVLLMSVMRHLLSALLEVDGMWRRRDVEQFVAYFMREKRTSKDCQRWNQGKKA